MTKKVYGMCFEISGIFIFLGGLAMIQFSRLYATFMLLAALLVWSFGYLIGKNKIQLKELIQYVSIGSLLAGMICAVLYHKLFFVVLVFTLISTVILYVLGELIDIVKVKKEE